MTNSSGLYISVSDAGCDIVHSAHGSSDCAFAIYPGIGWQACVLLLCFTLLGDQFMQRNPEEENILTKTAEIWNESLSKKRHRTSL